jgi:hypothetical protein
MAKVLVMAASDRIEKALAEYEAAHEFARQVTLPFEDRARYMPRVTWQGGYRWFRSPNVVCLEKISTPEESRPTTWRLGEVVLTSCRAMSVFVVAIGCKADIVCCGAHVRL